MEETIQYLLLCCKNAIINFKDWYMDCPIICSIEIILAILMLIYIFAITILIFDFIISFIKDFIKSLKPNSQSKSTYTQSNEKKYSPIDTMNPDFDPSMPIYLEPIDKYRAWGHYRNYDDYYDALLDYECRFGGIDSNYDDFLEWSNTRHTSKSIKQIRDDYKRYGNGY